MLSDPVTVNVSIGFRNLGQANGGTILGQTAAATDIVTYNVFKAALALDSKDTSDAAAAASLPVSVPGAAVRLTTAEARAISAPGGVVSSDGSIEFTTAINFADTRAALTSVTYDLIGIAEHELGHLLGFDSGVDDPAPAVRTALDVFRYSAAGTPSFAKGQAAYFSIDAGATDLANFETGSGYQASHWLQGTTSGGLPALMAPAVAAGNEQDITLLDVLALDALGYDTVAAVAVPEPAALALLVPALLGLARCRRAA